MGEAPPQPFIPDHNDPTLCHLDRRNHGPGGPPKVMKNGFRSATTLPRGTALPFVISTEAQRRGEISVWMLCLGNVFLAERTRISHLALLATTDHVRKAPVLDPGK
jgi:hypothetical protein